MILSFQANGYLEILEVNLSSYQKGSQCRDSDYNYILSVDICYLCYLLGLQDQMVQCGLGPPPPGTPNAWDAAPHFNTPTVRGPSTLISA